MPSTMMPTSAVGVLGLSVFVITMIFAVIAIFSLLPRRKPRRKPARLVHVPLHDGTQDRDDDPTDVMSAIQ